MNASNVAHERTRPVALRTKRSRVLVVAPVAPPPTPNVAIGAPPLSPGPPATPLPVAGRPLPGACNTPLLCRPAPGLTDQHVAGVSRDHRSAISPGLIAGC